ncbi:MAG: TlpA family protein disulfide reductase [Burkholderiales bacterium]
MPLGRREALILGSVGLAAATAGAVVGVLGLQLRSGAAALLAERFVDLEGRTRRLLDWQGRALLCNFWATWCAPCREEIPMLVAAKQHAAPHSIEIVGIGIDHADKVSEFVRIYKVNYPVLIGGATAIELMRTLGNRQGGLPFTVLLDRGGAVVQRWLGALTAQDLQQVLARFSR